MRRVFHEIWIQLLCSTGQTRSRSADLVLWDPGVCAEVIEKILFYSIPRIVTSAVDGDAVERAPNREVLVRRGFRLRPRHEDGTLPCSESRRHLMIIPTKQEGPRTLRRAPDIFSVLVAKHQSSCEWTKREQGILHTEYGSQRATKTTLSKKPPSSHPPSPTTTIQ